MRKSKLDNYTVTFSEPIHIVDIDDIVIPDDFKRTHCSHTKIRWAKEYYQRNGYMDKPISVIAETNERGLPNKLILVNEYSRYLAAINYLDLKYVEVKYIDIEEI